MESAEALQRHRLRLAERFRDLRISAGLSGHDLAALTGWSQSRVSRLETGRQRPVAEEVRQLGDALGLSRMVVNSLLDDLKVLEDEWLSFRELQHGGSNYGQVEVQRVEADASTIKHFERTLVPGLLQTPNYTRALCAVTNGFETDDDIEHVVSVRQERQQILEDSSKQFEFVVTDSALSTRYTTSDAMLEQVEHLIAQSHRRNVRLGILPRWSLMPFIPHSSFRIFDTRLVTVDTSNGQLTLRNKDDISEHIARFEKAKHCAVAGADAQEILRQLMSSYMV